MDTTYLIRINGYRGSPMGPVEQEYVWIANDSGELEQIEDICREEGWEIADKVEIYADLYMFPTGRLLSAR